MARIITSYYKDPRDDDEESVVEALSDDGHLPPPPEPDPIVEELARSEPVQPSAAPPQEDHIDVLAKDPEPKDAGPVTSAAEQRQYEARPWSAQSETDDDGEAPGLSGWAIAADLIFNGGKGLGQIVGMAEKQKHDWAQNRARYKGSAAQQEIARRQVEVQEQQNYLREMETGVRHDDKVRDQDLRDFSNNTGRKRVQNQADQFGQKADANSQYSQTQVTQYGEKARSAARARADVKHERAPITAQDAADQASAVSDATQDNKIELKKVETPGLGETKRHNAVTEKLAREGAGRAADKDARAADKDERDAANKLIDKSEDQIGMLSNIDTVLGVRDKWKQKGMSTPGIGTAESGLGAVGRNVASVGRSAFGGLTGMSKEDIAAYNQDAEKVANAVSAIKSFKLHDISGASAAEREFQRISEQIAKGGMSEDQTLVAIGQAQDLMKKIIAGRSVGQEGTARKVLERTGLDPNIAGPAPEAPAGPVAVDPLQLPPGPSVSRKPPAGGIVDSEETRKLREKYLKWKVQ